MTNVSKGPDLPTLRTPDGQVKTLAEWQRFATRDDCLDRMVPSDLRLILRALADAMLKARAAPTVYKQEFDG